MKAAEEANNMLASGVVARELHCTFNRFRARVAVVDAVRAGHRSNCGEPCGKCRHLLIVKIRAGHVNELGTLVLNRLHDFGMTMAGGVHRDASGKVEETVAIDIFDMATLTAL